MDIESDTYPRGAPTCINRAWSETCKVLLGSEVGDLPDFRAYLSKYVEPVYGRNSALSGEKVAVSRDIYASGAKFISNDEMPAYDAMAKAVQLDLNDIKDIDSIVRAVGENFYYSGNQISGNSQDVHSSDNVIDSSSVLNSTTVSGCKFVGYSSLCLSSEYLFGTNWCGDSKFLIKCFDCYKQSRCMETINVWSSSDVYFSAGLEDCTNCLFSFNRHHAQNLIGNRQFSKPEYSRYKEGLMEQVRGQLKGRHDLPGIIEILGD